MKRFFYCVMLLLLGSFLGVVIMPMLPPAWFPWSGHEEPGQQAATEPEPREPLYWVAPMDPNFRRDKPGKSPMGMDLVPVYADAQADVQDSPGTVKISPRVENNLGVSPAYSDRYRGLCAF
jgi:Cu(I)/Ag(I) efflux system membrane fusion protein